MDEFFKDIFLLELKRQVYFADNARKQIHLATQQLYEPFQKQPDMERLIHLESEVYRGIHSFLTHVSNASRILWPGSDRREARESISHYQERKRLTSERADELRKELGLTSDHVLKSRKLRDHLEHFDERIAAWAGQSENRRFVTDSIGPQSIMADVDKEDIMRWFNPVDWTFVFRGESYNLREMAIEIQRLLPILTTKEQELVQIHISNNRISG